MSFIALVY